ncbi:MAG: PIG-L family deacetylase, partial [bacterium]|nr:PIG-L family deacetylase [bacterium]
MKKIVAAIFAHPDDEAFGPSGTIAKYVKEDADVYLLCATKGEGGENHLLDKDERSIFEIREEELQNSAKALGVKQVFFLGFTDGTLCNNLYHKIADKILEILTPLNPEILITNEPRGVSGHIDHVTISMVTSYVFNKLPSAKTILYHCISEEYR